MNSALLLALALWSQPAIEPVGVVIFPPVNRSNPNFDRMDPGDARKQMDQTAVQLVTKAFKETSWVIRDGDEAKAALSGAGIEFTKDKQRGLEGLKAATTAAGTELGVLWLVESCTQKVASPGAILDNLARAGSESTATVRVWVYDATEGLLRLDGSKKVWKGVAKGPYFGTTNKHDLQGNPDDKGFVISQTHKKRAEWLGRAVFAAVKEALEPWLSKAPLPF